MMVPMHFDTFDEIRVDPKEFCSKAESRGIKCLPMHPGESLEIWTFQSPDTNGQRFNRPH
jgi:L-ascorbate metabolism protein UlaG (beta-lactamase superfamily)